MTRNVQMRNWTLYYTAAKYYIRSPLGDVMRYDLCSSHKFNEWYERQPHLGVFIMANGIPSYFCTAGPLAPPAPSAPPASAPPAPLALPAPSAPPASALPPASAPSKRAVQRRKPTKSHLVSLVLKAAIEEKRTCPITLEPITESSTCIAPCYHPFDSAAIDNWLETNTTCPECRETCVE